MGWRDRPYAQHDDEEDDDVDPEAPDESDMDSHDDPDLDVCPHCRKLILEDAEKCPHCGMYISLEDAPMSRRGWIALVSIALIVLILFVWSQWR